MDLARTPPSTQLNYGGSAVIEGVMFEGRTVYVTATREKDGTISVLETQKSENASVHLLKQIPVVRGIIGIFDDAKNSTHINTSYNKYTSQNNNLDEPIPPTDAQKRTSTAGATIKDVTIQFCTIVLFAVIPAAIVEWAFGSLFDHTIVHTAIEALIQIASLVAYMMLIVQIPIISRLFQYHGAEHKVANAFEAGVPLTVSNVQAHSRFHDRCGTSSVIITICTGFIIYSLPFFAWDSLGERLLIRISLLPVVIGVSYEVFNVLTFVRTIPLLRYIIYISIWFQTFTTKQPHDEHVEVAIASFSRLLEREKP
jgi:uncharacterized protein YqhQ